MIVDGRAVTTEILAHVFLETEKRQRRPLVRAIVIQPSSATESYLSIKQKRALEAGMDLELVRMESDATEEDILHKIELPGADSIIVQLPLPGTMNTERILSSIPLSKDADVLSLEAHRRFEEGEEYTLLPPVVGAVKEILERSAVTLTNKKVYVIGRGRLVGEPIARWLEQQGALVTIFTKEDGDLNELKNAEIIVSGAGQGGIIKPEHLMPGVVLIDAGTSESGGSIVGDADPSCADIASVFTPVPGGVGPVAVACLFKNVASLVARQHLQTP